MGVVRILRLGAEMLFLAALMLPFFGSTAYLVYRYDLVWTDWLARLIAIQWLVRVLIHMAICPIVLWVDDARVMLRIAGIGAMLLALSTFYEGGNIHAFRIHGPEVAIESTLYTFNVVATPLFLAGVLALRAEWPLGPPDKRAKKD